MADPLTVKELIAILAEVPEDALVYFNCVDNYYSGPMTGDSVATGPLYKLGPFEFSYETTFGRFVGSVFTGGWTTEQDPRAETLEIRNAVILTVE